MCQVAIQGLPEVSEGEWYVANDCFDLLAIFKTTTVGKIFVLTEKVFYWVVEPS